MTPHAPHNRHARRSWWILLFLFAGTLPLWAQSLSNQVLQLLARDNVWTGQQEFRDLRIPVLLPSETTNRLYNAAGDLYWDGTLLAGAGGGVTPHNLLSTTHGDTTASAAATGSLIYGNAQPTPAWDDLVIGAAGTVLRSNGTIPAWSTDASSLTALNATQLTSGTVPLARLSGLTTSNLSASAGVLWTQLNLTGSSLGDLATRSAADLSSGTLADARLSANVSLLGQTIENAEITNATITFSKWASNGCTSGQFTIYNGSAWICATVVPSTGTVESVDLTMPPYFSVAGGPVTTTGTLAVSLATQTANTIFAGPTTGAAAAPTFRALVNDDLPLTGVGAGTYTKVVVNTRGVITNGATQITLTTDVTGTLPTANGGTGLTTATDDVVIVGSGTVWAGLALPNTGTTGALQYTTATNTFSALANVTTSSNTQTLTNKTFDTTATGNVLSLWDTMNFPVGSCVTGTPTSVYYGNDNGVTTQAAVGCSSSVERTLAVFNFDAAASEAVVLHFNWPPYWDTATIDVRFRWFSATAAVVGDVSWNVDLMCFSQNNALPTAFSGAINAVTTVSATAGAPVQTVATPTLGGANCTANWPAAIRITRNGASGSDTMAGDASLFNVQVAGFVTH